MKTTAGGAPTPVEEACEHDLAERETACADGMCPLCLSRRLQALERDALRYRWLRQVGEAGEHVRIMAFAHAGFVTGEEFDAGVDAARERT